MTKYTLQNYFASLNSLIVNMLTTAAPPILWLRSFFLCKYSRIQMAVSAVLLTTQSRVPHTHALFWWGRERKNFVHNLAIVMTDFVICVAAVKPGFFSFSGCITSSFSLKSSPLNCCGNKCQ